MHSLIVGNFEAELSKTFEFSGLRNRLGDSTFSMIYDVIMGFHIAFESYTIAPERTRELAYNRELVSE